MDAVEATPKHENQLRPILMTAISLLALFLVWFGLEGKAKASRESVVKRYVAALAQSLAPTVLDTKSQRFENRLSRLERALVDVNDAGSFESVTVTEPDGKVLATTDRKFESETIDPVKDPTQSREGEILITKTPVVVGDQTVGILIVRSKD